MIMATTTELKIASGSWTDLNESKLDTFSTNVAEVTTHEDYVAVRTEANALASDATSYHKALSRYLQFGGTENKDAKDAAKKALYASHQALAEKLEETCGGSMEYLTRPGYHLDGRGGNRSTAKVPSPVLQSVESKSVRGRVKFILKAANPREIKGIIGKSSEDNGLTWKNGINVFSLNFVLEDQPSGKPMIYQFMFHATNSRQSDWSESIRIDVF